MEPVGKRNRILIRVAAGILLAAMLAGAVLYATVRPKQPAQKEAATKPETTTEAALPEDSAKPAGNSDPARERESDTVADAGEATLNVSPLLPMEQSENPRVVGTVEIFYETKEETP